MSEAEKEELFAMMVRGEISQREYESILSTQRMEVGQRVRIKNNTRAKNGKEGTIVHKKAGSIGVEHDDLLAGGGHNCGGHIKTNKGWYYDPEYLEIIES